MNRLFLAILSFVFTQVLPVNSQVLSPDITPIFKNITIDDGLINNEVKHIQQDNQGFIWFATGSGICRYDGYSVQNFKPISVDEATREKLSWRPLKMILDTEGNLYLASDFAGLMFYDKKRHKLLHLTTQNSALPSDAIFDMAYDDRQTIWLGTAQGIARLDLQTRYLDQPFSSDESITRVRISPDHAVWYSALGKGIFRFDPVADTVPTKVSSKICDAIFPISHDSILLGGGNQIDLYIKSDSSELPVYTLPGSAKISDIIRDHKGNIWIGTYNQGLFHHSSNGSFHFAHQPGNRQSIVSEHIANLFEDRNSNIWIGTYGDGVSVINTDFDHIKLFSPRPAQSNTSISVQQVIKHQEEIWFHTGQELFEISKSGLYATRHPLPTGKACNDIAVISTFENQLLIAGGCQIYAWDPQKPEILSDILQPFETLPHTRILSINTFGQQIYLGTTHTDSLAGWWHIDREAGTLFHFTDDGQVGSITGNQVTRTFVSSTGDHWIATWNDLNLYREPIGFIAIESVITECECLKGGSTVVAIHEDHCGLIWFGRIDNGGLMVIDPVTMENNCFLQTDGLPDNSITAIFQDSDHNIWLGTYRGIVKLEYPADPLHSKDLKIKIIDKTSGLPNSTIWNGATDGRGHHYFGTRDGLLSIVGNQMIFDRRAPSVLLSGFESGSSSDSINQNLCSFPTDIRMPPRDKVFSINFAIDNQYLSNSAIYNYRFSNLDTEWIDIGKQHGLTFANLSPGNYQFEVRAKLPNSSWGISKQLAFIIIPPLYRRWWFLVALFVLVLLSVYYLQQYRINNLRKIQLIREQISTDLHDEIGSALSNIEIISGIAVRKPENQKSSFKKITETARSSNDALHQIVWNLNPTYDQLANMVPYLVNYAARILDDAGISLQMEQTLGSLPMSLEINRRKDLFLTFKEAINNIVRHSRSDLVHLRFEVKSKNLIIVIRDFGNAHKIHSIIPGNGLTNMEMRMNRSGGKMKYKSVDPFGFEVCLEIPVT